MGTMGTMDPPQGTLDWHHHMGLAGRNGVTHWIEDGREAEEEPHV